MAIATLLAEDWGNLTGKTDQCRVWFAKCLGDSLTIHSQKSHQRGDGTIGGRQLSVGDQFLCLVVKFFKFRFRFLIILPANH